MASELPSAKAVFSTSPVCASIIEAAVCLMMSCFQVFQPIAAHKAFRSFERIAFESGRWDFFFLASFNQVKTMAGG